MTTVNAAVYTATNTIKYIENYNFEQQPRNDDVKLEVIAAGICGSDMHAYHGKDSRRKPNLILGHEFSARVVEGELKDQMVTGNPLITCGKCRYCVEGRDNLCSDKSMVGMNRQGAFANFVRVPQKCLVPLPSGLNSNKAALTEPCATVIHGVELLKKYSHRSFSDSEILIIGGGAIGFLAALYLQKHSKKNVILETNPLRIKEIKNHIEINLIDPTNASVPKNNFDLVIDCVGSAITRDLALESVALGGSILHLGLQESATNFDLRKATIEEITIIGSYAYTMSNFKQALLELAQGGFGNCDWLLEAPLSEAEDIFKHLDKGQISSAKVLLKP